MGQSSKLRDRSVVQGGGSVCREKWWVGRSSIVRFRLIVDNGVSVGRRVLRVGRSSKAGGRLIVEDGLLYCKLNIYEPRILMEFFSNHH